MGHLRAAEPSPPTGPDGHPASRIWRSPARQLLVIAGLTGFAISQPLLGLLGDAPTILARYGIEGTELVWLAVLIAFVPPLVLWGATRLAALIDERLEHPMHLDRPLHLAVVAALVGCFAIQIAKSLGLSGAVALLLAASLAAGGFVVAYVRLVAVATWASYTAILPFLAAGAFLFTSPASALLSSAEAPERVAGAGDLPPVVLIVLDELPTRSILDANDQIDGDRFPNLASFAEDATWYRHHNTLATLTEVAVPSLLTGQPPVEEKAIWTNYPDNLFTLLAPTHELEVLEQATQLCPYDTCVPTGGTGEAGTAAAGPGFAELLDVARDLWFERVSLGEEAPESFDDFAESVGPTTPTTTEDTTSPSVTELQPRPNGDPAAALSSSRADAIVRSMDSAKGPALYYLHLILPHQPFVRYPDGSEYEVTDPIGIRLPEEDGKHLFSWSPWVSAVSEQQHLMQGQYADAVLGDLLDGAKESGIYDDSLVIVMADHGISFEANTAGRYVESSTVDAIAYTPLLVKLPGQTEGAIDDANVRITDVLPTIADVVDVDVPWEVDGAPLGSDAIADRGSGKQIYDVIGFGGLRIREILDFDDPQEFATVKDRFIEGLPDPDDPLSALQVHLGIEGLVGRELDDLVVGDDDRSVSLHRLDELRHAGAPPIGIATGDVSDAPDDARLLLAVDGVVVGGSELSTDSQGRSGRIFVLLPQGTLGGDKEIRAALLYEDGAIRELEVRSF